ncbi:MAG: chemotaxis protein CheZ [Rhodospirillaceae bacterium]|jgi:chemotaxis protein CheZ|nr:chemotaxis protein CheZ [Rhodospirillaceae bacterium]
MASQNINPELAVRLGDLREKHGDSVKVEDISAVVESMMATMKGDLSATDIELYSELEALAQYIHAAKADIAALRPDEVKDDSLPTAADELDAIVAATEKATNTIMDATEQIEGLMDKVDPEDASVIMEATSTIYEACGFQDITGQRTTKVVKALKDIEEKIDALVEAFGSEIEKFKNDNPKADEESGRELTDEDLLEGPQLEEQAQTQEEIDALLATFD